MGRGAAWSASARTFQQNTASFALARRLKQRYPHLVTVFGGANFDGEMGLELVRAVDCVDLAVIGEGDAAFPRLLGALADRRPTRHAVPGAGPPRGRGRSRRRRRSRWPTASTTCPPPDYAEYFERAERLGLLPRVAPPQVWLPFETARGCWWGEKHHCTFCGLNGTAMRFRGQVAASGSSTSSPALARRYRTFRFEAVDNILDMRYLTELFPALAESETGYEIFYEVKANLTRAQLRLLARGGVTHLQPGIESLSTHVLRLMHKGVRAAQNVNLLRWARYYGIDVAWNLLWGFPGETAEDYAEQAAVVPHLVHLQPPRAPTGSGWSGSARCSPNRSPFGFAAERPERSYRYVYPGDVDLDRVAYFFDYELAGALPDSAYAGVRDAAAAGPARGGRRARRC